MTNLVDKFGIDPLAAAHAEMIKNAARYPVAMAWVIARKYNDL